MSLPVFDTSPGSEFSLAVQKGAVPGTSFMAIAGTNPNLSLNTQETLSDQGGIYTYLNADTPLFVSSSSASDTAVAITVSGMTDDFVNAVAVATTNGQNQVALSSNLFRVFAAINLGSVDPLGDIYIAEADTLTGGVPDTPSKIKAKIIQGINVSFLGLITIPAGQTAFGIRSIFISGKGDNIVYDSFIRPNGGVFISGGQIELYQTGVQLSVENTVVAEKTDVEFRGTADNAGARATIFSHFYLVDNDKIPD